MKLVTWGVALDDDGDAQSAARAALEVLMAPDSTATAWKVVDTVTGVIEVVDIETGHVYEGRVIEPN